MLGLQWLMQVHEDNYLQDYGRPFGSWKQNKELTHIARPCDNESEK